MTEHPETPGNNEMSAKIVEAHRGPEDDPYERLRKDVLQAMRQDIERRTSVNVSPTAEELNAGTSAEDIEPQCRSAVFLMRRKGYNTMSSGFAGDGRRMGKKQMIDGLFRLDPETIKKLRGIGIEVESNEFHTA